MHTGDASDTHLRRTVKDLSGTLRFMRALWALDHGLNSGSKRMKASLGVTGLQRLVVRMVARHPGATPGDLSAILHTDPSTLTGVLQRLERRGVIKRAPDLQDGRRAHLQVTKKGAAIDLLHSGTVETAVQRALAQATPTQVRATEHVLGLLVAELEALAREDGARLRPATVKPRRARQRTGGRRG